MQPSTRQDNACIYDWTTAEYPTCAVLFRPPYCWTVRIPSESLILQQGAFPTRLRLPVRYTEHKQNRNHALKTIWSTRTAYLTLKKKWCSGAEGLDFARDCCWRHGIYSARSVNPNETFIVCAFVVITAPHSAEVYFIFLTSPHLPPPKKREPWMWLQRRLLLYHSQRDWWAVSSACWKMETRSLF